MRYTVEDIIKMPEGQTFDCKSFRADSKALAVAIVGMANADGGMIAVGISDKTREIEGVDRMCRELNALGSEGVHYHLVAFIMHATAYAAQINGTTQETTQKRAYSMGADLPLFLRNSVGMGVNLCENLYICTCN